MMTRRAALAATFAILAAPILSESQQVQPRAQAPLIFPYDDRGACPFECCTYRTWTAKEVIAIRRTRRADAPVIFRVRNGEQVDALTGIVTTVRPGRARVGKSAMVAGIRLEATDDVIVLRYVGEGVWKAWFKGAFFSVEVSDDGPAPEDHLRMIERPRTAWWVQVRNRGGEIGWTDRPNDFDGTDACG